MNEQTISFNTQPPEGGWKLYRKKNAHYCFNTQPPEGGCAAFKTNLGAKKCFNTQPPEGGCNGEFTVIGEVMFQHTAARRRLAVPSEARRIGSMFQHTAARRRLL